MPKPDPHPIIRVSISFVGYEDYVTLIDDFAAKKFPEVPFKNRRSPTIRFLLEQALLAQGYTQEQLRGEE